MKKTVEIRWHGRGGQGAKTAALLLADVCFKTGAFVQGFPEYGPERMGAPITAYDRISDKEIRVHSNIYEPDYVVPRLHLQSALKSPSSTILLISHNNGLRIAHQNRIFFEPCMT